MAQVELLQVLGEHSLTSPPAAAGASTVSGLIGRMITAWLRRAIRACSCPQSADLGTDGRPWRFIDQGG
jgi:hypothetical protein